MLGHGRLAEPERPDEVADAALGPPQLVQDPPPRRLGHTTNVSTLRNILRSIA
jgi:hypothetical protein